jgi:ABC-type amino acid transport substrate-binding protein
MADIDIMQPNLHAQRRIVYGMIGLLVFLSFPATSISQDESTTPRALQVGVIAASPLRGKVHGLNDLYNAKVGSVFQSEGFDFLTKQGIAVIPFEGIKEGMAAVAGRNIDAFFLNEQVLKYQTKKEFAGQVQVLPEIYDEYFVSIALPENSSLRKPINKALLKLMKTNTWTELRHRYIQ